MLEEIANFTMYQKAMSRVYDIDQSILPFDKIDRSQLEKAMEILKQICKELNDTKGKNFYAIGADHDLLVKSHERMMELSSAYYEIIPQTKFKDQIAEVIGNERTVKAQFDCLQTLMNIEFASKLLLGALYQQGRLNSPHPIDYISTCLEVTFEHVAPGPEFDLIN